MRPSLIIGIGGTGMVIGHALKYFIHTLLPDNERNNFKFVFIDNDKNQFADFRTKYISKYGDFSNEIIKITDFSPYYVYQKIKAKEEKNKHLDKIYDDLYQWYDPTVAIKPQIYEEGLAGNRMIGRMCGYVNYTNIENGIRYASEQLRKIFQDANKTIDDKSINVYIITSNSGGTGSSLFFDISTIVDNIFNLKSLQIPKTLIFVGPNYYLSQKRAKNFTEADPEYKNLQINSWAFIDECEFFISQFDKDNTLMAKYFCKPSVLENKIEAGTIFSPFTSAWVFDHITSKGKKINDDRFFNSIAEVLFHTLTSSSNDTFISELTVNTFIQKDKGKVTDINLEQYTSIGIKVLRYPKEEFEKYFRVRYVYEVFKKFLDRKPLERTIENIAKEFVSKAFTDKESIVSKTAFTAFDEHIRMNSDTSYVRFKEKYEENLYGLFKKEGSDNFKDESEIKDEFRKHDNDLETFKNKVEELYQSLRKTNLIVAFKDRYQARVNASDNIREILWKQAYNVISEVGYYGIVGIQEQSYKTKGYIEIIREMLLDYYVQTAKEFSQIDVNISKIMEDITKLRDIIIKKSKALIGTKKVTTAQNEINNYINKLKEYRDKIIEKYYLIIKQEILYHFAVGDASGAILRGSAFGSQLASDTELTRYEKEIKLRIGTSILLDDTYTTSLIKEFDDNKQDSYTIRNNYVKHLPSEFRESEKDVFTTYLPMPLVSLLDVHTEDGWKSKNELDQIFRSNIKITKNEIDNIIDGVDKENWMVKFALLGDVQNQIKSVKPVIDEIKDRVEKYCEKNYINNSESVVGQYLNRSIDKVINNLDENIKNNLIQMINDIDYPINTADLASIQAAGPYYNVSPTLIRFVKETFKPKNENDVIGQDIGENKIVAILYKRGINYKNLMNNEVHLAAYQNRDLKIYRPFLHKKWNEYVRGPWEDKSLSNDTLNIQIARKQKELNYKQLIAFFYGIDLLLSKNSQLADSIFDRRSEIKRSLIHYDDQTWRFCYANNVKCSLKENKITISRGLNNDGIIDLPISLNENEFIKDKEYNNLLKFEESANKLSKDKEFKEAVNNFCLALTKNKQTISKVLSKSITEINTEFNALAQSVNTQKQKFNIDDQDLNFAYDFDANMIKLLKDFFSVK